MKPIALIPLWLCLIASSTAGPIFVSYQDGAGQYSFGYRDSMAARAEHKGSNGITQGTYSYVDENGLVQTTDYKAGKDIGFQVKATNLPVAPLPIQDTPEVRAVRDKHIALLEEIKRSESLGIQPPPTNSLDAPLPVQDTPEVKAVRDRHLALLEEVKLRESLGIGSPAQQANLVDTPMPVQDTPEVKAVRNRHLAMLEEINRREKMKYQVQESEIQSSAQNLPGTLPPQPAAASLPTQNLPGSDLITALRQLMTNFQVAMQNPSLTKMANPNPLPATLPLPNPAAIPLQNQNSPPTPIQNFQVAMQNPSFTKMANPNPLPATLPLPNPAAIPLQNQNLPPTPIQNFQVAMQNPSFTKMANPNSLPATLPLPNPAAIQLQNPNFPPTPVQNSPLIKYEMLADNNNLPEIINKDVATIRSPELKVMEPEIPKVQTRISEEQRNEAMRPLIAPSVPNVKGPQPALKQNAEMDTQAYHSVTYTPDVQAARDAHFRAFDNAAKLAAESDTNPQVLNELLKGPAAAHLVVVNNDKIEANMPVSRKSEAEIQSVLAKVAMDAIPANFENKGNLFERRMSENQSVNKNLPNPPKIEAAPKLKSEVTPANTRLRMTDVSLPTLDEFEQSKIKAATVRSGKDLKVTKSNEKSKSPADRLLIVKSMEPANIPSAKGQPSLMTMLKNWAFQYMRL